MKAECIAQYKQLEGILDKGDIVEIETIKSTKDTVLSWKYVEDPAGDFKRGGKTYRKAPDLLSEAGSYLDWKFKSMNGHYYTGTGITNRIGNKTLFDLFKKL